MQETFDRYRKAIITGGGVLVFLLAGLLTMLLTNSKNEPAPLPKETQQVKNESPVPEPVKPPKFLYVYVTGEVRNPGVYKLSEDARVFQLIDSAGGFTSKADKDFLNLADFLSDGLHIHVGAKLPQSTQTETRIPGVPVQTVQTVQPVQPIQYVQTVQPVQAAQTRTQSSRSKSTVSTEKVDINHANAQELEKLRGVGPAIAKRIVDYRNSHGHFTKPEDLINVRGIGVKTLEKMRDQIVIR